MRRQKKKSVQCNGKQKEAITMVPKPELQKTSPYSYHFRKATKKEKQKGTTPQLSLMFVPCPSFPTELQFHPSYRWLSQLNKRQTDGYRTIPGKCPCRTDISLCFCHTIRHSAIKAVWSLLRFPRWQNADINSWQLLERKQLEMGESGNCSPSFHALFTSGILSLQPRWPEILVAQVYVWAHSVIVKESHQIKVLPAFTFSSERHGFSLEQARQS